MLKWALGAIIILILLSGVGLSILLDQPERFRPQIEALAAEQVGAPIRLGQLSWQWQPNFALSVSEVEINPNDGPIVQVQLVDVDFKASLLALLTEQSLVVLGIEVERMSVVQREASSASSTPEARAQSQPSETQEDTANEAWQASLQELPALLLTTFEQVEVNQLKVNTLTLETEGRSEPDVILSAIRLTMQGSQLTARLEGKGSQLGATGIASWSGGLSIELSVTNDAAPSVSFAGDIEGKTTLADSTVIPLSARVSTAWTPADNLLRLNALTGIVGGLEFSGEGTINPLTRLSPDRTPFNVNANLALSKESAIAEQLRRAGAPFPLASAAISMEASSTGEQINLSIPDASVNEMSWTGEVTFNLPNQRLTGLFEASSVNIDALAATDDAEGGNASSTSELNDPLWPDALFEGPSAEVTVTAREVLYDGLVFQGAVVTASLDRDRALVTASADLADGALSSKAIIFKDSARAHTVHWQADKVNLNRLAAPLTPGLLKGEGDYQFTGATLNAIGQSLKGSSKIELSDGVVELVTIKSMLATLDGLIGTQSGANTWPDRVSFDKAVGAHQVKSGVREGQ
ncbi:MAG: hypothetical protein EBY55_07445, partial [Gammaproteobacteria bacterium]|nr:hypothetical protein [Gammaproteobacteria bacterium]